MQRDSASEDLSTLRLVNVQLEENRGNRKRSQNVKWKRCLKPNKKKSHGTGSPSVDVPIYNVSHLLKYIDHVKWETQHECANVCPKSMIMYEERMSRPKLILSSQLGMTGPETLWTKDLTMMRPDHVYNPSKIDAELPRISTRTSKVTTN